MAKERLGVISDLIEAPKSAKERQQIISDYIPIRVAFEQALRKGKFVGYSLLDKLHLGRKADGFWKGEMEVDTPLGPVKVYIGTDAFLSSYAHLISQTTIELLITKENDTDEGIEENAVVLHLEDLGKVTDSTLENQDYDDMKSLVEQLKPLVDLMKEQGFIL